MDTARSPVPVDLERAARATLLPAFAESELPPAVRRFLQRGGTAVLIGETREEYVARQMSPARRARESRTSFAGLVDEIRAAAAGSVVIALDHELGGIQRCEGLVGALPDAVEARTLPVERLEARCHEVALELRELGVDLALAPVLDIAADNPWLAGRLLDGPAADVARVGAAFVRGFERAGVATSPKHFPGHQGLRIDPMVEGSAVVAVDSRHLVERLEPFRAAVRAGASCAMIGPGTFPALDAERPAVSSPAVLGLLREQLQFAGVAITDDLDAPAIAGQRCVAEVAADALLAGSDLLLLAATADLDATALTIALRAEAAGADGRARLGDAAARVHALARRTRGRDRAVAAPGGLAAPRAGRKGP